MKLKRSETCSILLFMKANLFQYRVCCTLGILFKTIILHLSSSASTLICYHNSVCKLSSIEFVINRMKYCKVAFILNFISLSLFRILRILTLLKTVAILVILINCAVLSVFFGFILMISS